MKGKTHIDERGHLTVFDLNNLPFWPERMFYVTNCKPYTTRGNHAHIDAKQYYICLKGLVKVKLNNKGTESEVLLKQSQCLFVDNMVWSSEEFYDGNTVLLVLSDKPYDPKDHITNLNEYMAK